MADKVMKVAKCPTDELSLTNCAVVSEQDFDTSRVRHVDVRTTPQTCYVFTLRTHPAVQPGTIAFNLPQRKWGVLSLGQQVNIRPHVFNPKQDYLGAMVVEVDFFMKKNTTTEPFDTDKMALEFVNQFPQQAFTVGQELVFSFMDKKVLSVIVRELEAMDISGGGKGKKVQTGLTSGNTALCFEKADNSPINLIGKSKR